MNDPTIPSPHSPSKGSRKGEGGHSQPKRNKGQPVVRLPSFFDSIGRLEMQQHLIRRDASGKISHLIAVPMHRLSHYVNDSSIHPSKYLWKLRSLNCCSLRRICSRLGITQSSFRNGTGSTECLKAILRQPGNRTWNHHPRRRTMTTATKQSSPSTILVDPVISAASVTTSPEILPNSSESLRSQSRRGETKLLSGTKVSTNKRKGALEDHTLRALVSPVKDANAAAPMVGRVDWNTFAEILEGHRRSIEQKRNQEFAYYRALNSGMIHDDVRRRMVRTVETIQESIRHEEQALERLQLHYHDSMTRATNASYTICDNHDGARDAVSHSLVPDHHGLKGR